MARDHLHCPDRQSLLTEQRLPASSDLDNLSITQTLELINDQDAAVPHVVRNAIPDVARLVERVVAAFTSGGRLIYLGAGTSGRLGVLDASECPPTFQSHPSQVVGVIAGGDTALRTSSEGAEDNPDGATAALKNLNLTPHDVVVGIAAGGTTPYVLGALHLAKQHHAATALISCDSAPPNQLQPHPDTTPDFLILLPVGPEVLTGSTRLKAGTATKLVLNMITTTAMAQTGKCWGNLMADLRAHNAKLVDRALRILSSQCDLPRDAAITLLTRADNHVKTAIVMHKLNLDPAAAKQLLGRHHGKLRPILGPPR